MARSTSGSTDPGGAATPGGEGPPASAPPPRSRFRLGEKERFSLYLILPAAVVMVMFQVVPIVMGANASFRIWPLYNPEGTWVGLRHYYYVLSDSVFLTLILPNTFMLMFFSVSISLVLGLALSHLLNREFIGRGAVQTVILLPLMIAPVVASIMMRWMFNDQFGIATVVVEALGFRAPPWLSRRWWAFSVIVFTDVWIWTPWFTIILLAGLKSLPKEPFEAAAIDAASAWRVFTHLTLPMLQPVIAVCVVIRSIDAFRTFDQVWVITAGGPARSTEVFSVYAYVEAFQSMNFARGSAAAIVGAIIIIAFGMLMYRVLNRVMQVSR